LGTWPGTKPTEVASESWPELENPAPNRLIGHVEPAFGRSSSTSAPDRAYVTSLYKRRRSKACTRTTSSWPRSSMNWLWWWGTTSENVSGGSPPRHGVQVFEARGAKVIYVPSCATGIWLIFGMAIFHEHAGRSVGGRWTVTACEKSASRPALARVNVPTTTPIVP
jgi:hypothetical protein